MSAPWLDHYDPGIPRSLVYPQKTLVDVLRERAQQGPAAVALVFKGRKLSYADVDRMSDALAHTLTRLGVKQGDRVALVLPNAPQFIISLFAAWKIGAIVAPQNPIYTDRELEDSLRGSELAACINPYRGPNKLGSVGMPLPDVHVGIVDADDGTRELRAGEIGEIVIRAPQLMRRYWNNPEETEAVLRRDAHGSRALFTGDLGYLDEDGYLFIVDRKKDLIKTSGFQVWPREIEEVIATHPAIAEVGMAGVPDARKGEVVMAWVVPRGDKTITEAELRDFCRDKLAPYKIPARVEIRKELPKTMVGKVLRRALVAEAKTQMAGA